MQHFVDLITSISIISIGAMKKRRRGREEVEKRKR
jgi:hypothetical protein